MVFWSKLRQAIKSSVSKLDFLKLEKKVKTNESDIAINKEQINTLNETTNTNSSDILEIKNNYARKNATNTFTQINTFNNNVKILNDKELNIGYTDNDIKLRVYCDQGAKHMNITNPQGDIKINTPNGNVFINTRDTLNLGTKRINNLGTPTQDQDAATKKYVDNVQDDLNTQKAIITNMEERLDEIPNTYLSKSDATNTYLSKVDAQADYARTKSGITNDWHSINNFRTTPQSFGGVNYTKDLTTKEYVDGKLTGLQQIKKQRISGVSYSYFEEDRGKWKPFTYFRFNENMIVLAIKWKIRTQDKGTYFGYMNRFYGVNTTSNTAAQSEFDFQFTFQSARNGTIAYLWFLTQLPSADLFYPEIDIYYIDAF